MVLVHLVKDKNNVVQLSFTAQKYGKEKLTNKKKTEKLNNHQDTKNELFHSAIKLHQSLEQDRDHIRSDRLGSIALVCTKGQTILGLRATLKVGWYCEGANSSYHFDVRRNGSSQIFQYSVIVISGFYGWTPERGLYHQTGPMYPN